MTISAGQEQNGLLIEAAAHRQQPRGDAARQCYAELPGEPSLQCQKANFAPNIGLAWSPKENFVLRGGYSITYAQEDLLEAVLSTVDINSGITGTSNITNAAGVISNPPALTPRLTRSRLPRRKTTSIPEAATYRD